MKSFIICSLIVFSITGTLYAQFPHEEWSNRYGNISILTEPTLLPMATSDGGFLILSSEYGKQNNPVLKGGYDLVLTKTNSEGFIQWKKSYGGSGSDYGMSLNFIKANDGGFLITGNSYSIDGDLPVNNDPINGNLWVLKIDEDGNILFSKIIKSDYDTYESILSIIPLNDSSGYLGILNLYDNTPGKHSNGFFTNCTGGTLTYKLIKLDNTGNVTFQKCLATDNGNIYRGFSITNGPNNKYLISSSGMIPSNCNVSQPAFLGMINDTLFYFWKKTIDLYNLPSTHYMTGTPKFDVLRNADNFIFPMADLTISCNGNHSLVLMCLDTMGNLIWKNTLPGYNFNNFVTPVDAGDGVSFYMMQNPRGINSFPDTSFICKFSYTGNLLAKKVLSTYKDYQVVLDFRPSELFKVGDEIYYGGTNTGHNYDPANYSSYTKPMLGKLGPVNCITGYAFHDTNSNKIKDAGEIFLHGLTILGQKANGHFSMDVTDSGGNYQMLADTGAYTYTVSAEGINNFTVSPTPATTNHTGYLFADTINFALTAIQGMNDFSVNLVPFTPVIPGVKASYRLICRNNGTVPLNARLKLIKMPTMILNSSSRLYDSLQVDTISWNYTNFRQLTTDTINLSFNVLPPPMVNINDTINTIAFVEIDSSQTNTMNDTTRLKQVARNAVDPNEKTERNAGSFSLLQLTNGDRLEYTIHFQNTGTYTANTVIVRDTLDEQLDWSTLKIIASGHAGNFILRNENKLEWKFDNINLPAAAFPEDTASMSFITYSVKPRSTVQIESVIKNKAAIYFDYNLPINTAEEQTIIYQPANAMRTYKFNGSGYWTNAANWFNGQMPPAILKIGDMVTITGACILDTIVHASAGSSITVATGGTLLIQGNLIMQ